MERVSIPAVAKRDNIDAFHDTPTRPVRQPMRVTPRCPCRGVPCGRPHCEEAFEKVGQAFLSACLDADDVSAQMGLPRVWR